MLKQAKWICGQTQGCPQFDRQFSLNGMVQKAVLQLSAHGVYEAKINGARVGDFYLAPGWTVYEKRIQVQRYDVTALLQKENALSITLGGGWYSGEIARAIRPKDTTPNLIGQLTIDYADGRSEIIVTDESWTVRESPVRYADIYQGETYDATYKNETAVPATALDLPHDMLIEQQGEKIVAMEQLTPVRSFITPKGEQVVDFGQEITGIVNITLQAPKGTAIRICCAEMLDTDGNFYTENYRSAKSEMNYVCAGQRENWQSALTFYGFRYLRIEGIGLDAIMLRAIVLCSDIKRTGELNSGSSKLNRLFENIIWGQKGNFVDVPTDCPQRDERLGWTGDAQVFVNTACWQFDVKRFFIKWLNDVKLEQRQNGAIPCVVPNILDKPDQMPIKASTAWGETATVCPWQIYRHYGDKQLLRSHFDMMRRWVDFMTDVTLEADLWIGYDTLEGHFGDWLGLDAHEGSYIGASNTDLIASANYYYSCSLVIEAGHILGLNVEHYETLKERIYKAFIKRFNQPATQTECVIMLHYGLTEQPGQVTEKLVSLIALNGGCLTTGFVGTPYLLFALSENGQTKLAYDLLLQEKFPSWLYSVNAGATTVWEHWDGRKPDGSFWSRDMNSFNHYAYGAVASWVYEVAAGITPTAPGFSKLRIAPQPDHRLGWLKARHETAYGPIESAWYFLEDRIRYEITTPVEAELIIEGKQYSVKPGKYLF